MKEQISFIHAADLHLDSPFQGLAHTPEHIFSDLQASTFTALKKLVQAAIEKQVDFVLLVGDLFDNEKQSLKAQIRLRRAFEDLEQHQIPVYISYGNHDYLNGNKYAVTYPSNVFIFQDEQVNYFTYKRNGKAIANIYGFSYKNRAVETNKAKEYYVQDEQIPYHISMLHGSLHSNTEHDVYAPFYLSDLVNKDFDYWALGHIHKREILKENPYIIYPGNIQGRNRKEQGEKGCYHVRMSPTNTTASFIPLQAIQFNEVSLDVSNCEEVYHLENEIKKKLGAELDPSISQLVQLKLTSNNRLLKQWETEQYLDDLIELINETLAHQKPWMYIFRYTAVVHASLFSDEMLYRAEHFMGELIRHFDKVSVHSFTKELFEHRQARKYLDCLSTEDEKRIKEKAKQLLMNELMMNEGE
ncbi:metallophosphoesterase family protein [Virgibacillus alimentarius]|uniref:metallophosphoesterase family protein n=1 Tax=Virgibacillus alimentarius TaxID=698769 RepID=UPI0004930CC3|nr:exonuclease SbcCD subunit D [Virgibacillus alimentarius]